MTMPTPLTATLRSVADIMREAQDPWWIIAGAAVALHGADPGHVTDVDVLTSISDATRILRLLGVEPAPGSTHPDFRSDVFGTWTEAPLAIEIMAGFHYRSGRDWLPVHPASRAPVTVQGAIVFVPDRQELRGLLMAFGRPKDLERVRRLG